MIVNSDYREWYKDVIRNSPHPWQVRLSEEDACRSRMIRIPTGMGKTLGALSAWCYHRLVLGDESWPRRLVWCLPMRVLTEQTAAEACAFLEAAGLAPRVRLHVLMGGEDADAWHMYPEQEAVIIGTQDMLLSRALNRGYASPRARWPMEFGLLSQDTLWVYDEIQLMDVGLATAAQLQAYREEDAARHLRPVHSWWMSATLRSEWLDSPETRTWLEAWTRSPVTTTPPEWGEGAAAASKTLSVEAVPDKDDAGFAKRVLAAHKPGTLTLVVCNTVDRACKTHSAILKLGRDIDNTHLVHGRFRPVDRAAWRESFLQRGAAVPEAGRILVATQVVEAGVDIGAEVLVTELAPWPSLVQRFGRCARYGGQGEVLVIDRGDAEGKKDKPYPPEALKAAREALKALSDVGIPALEAFERDLPESDRAALYPYIPAHLLLRQDYDDLFDTTPDLTGADLDVSRFIRTGEERDCYVAWWSWPEKEGVPDDVHPPREALCAVPVYQAEDWRKKVKGAAVLRAHRFDYLDGTWKRLRPSDAILPGMVLVVDAAGGGYDPRRGFTGEPPRKGVSVPVVGDAAATAEERADEGQDREDLSVRDGYATIAEHGWAVAQAVGHLADACAPTYRTFLKLAARLHDWGKAHPAFRNSIAATDAPDRPDLAKAPPGAWHSPVKLYGMGEGQPRRAGFRHELATVLAVYETLARRNPAHPALLGGVEELLACGAVVANPPPLDGGEGFAEGGGVLAEELASLSAEEVDLVCYLIASHHGKVRASWHACPQDQEYPVSDEGGFPLRGIREGDLIPPIPLPDAEGREQDAPSVTLHLALAYAGVNDRYGISWRERSLGLQARFGAAALAYLEAILRAADIRVSRGETIQTGGRS